MRLFLIRHGETVDNVASLWAGSRDSALTSHGVLQCRRLADHLVPKLSPAASPSTTATTAPPTSDGDAGSVQPEPDASSPLRPVPRVYMFSSNLQRAVKTAEAIRDGLAQWQGRQQPTVEVRQLSQLGEQHFGSGEGQSFRLGTGGKVQPHIGAETPAEMRARADAFLEHHLLPLLTPTALVEDDGPVIVVVSHGLMLGALARRLMDHLQGRHTWGPEVTSLTADGRDTPALSWSNTGYLEARLSPSNTLTSPLPDASSDAPTWTRVSIHVSRINVTDHLRGLRKTRGGIGSARFDDKQSTINSFFSKKRKLADAAD